MLRGSTYREDKKKNSNHLQNCDECFRNAIHIKVMRTMTIGKNGENV